MAKNLSDVAGDLRKYTTNPMASVRVWEQSWREASNGALVLSDASNPFIMSLEAHVVNTMMQVEEVRSAVNGTYATMATTQEELFRHMADDDAANIFSLPSKATFKLVIPKHELEDVMVLDEATNISYATIPRNSYVSIAGRSYSIQYPIVIRKFAHGEFQAVYDASVVSPLLSLPSNVLPVEFVSSDGVEFLMISFETQQFSILSTQNSVDSASGYSSTVTITDKFYYCRAYNYVNGQWVELQTTYTDEVVDPLTPTIKVTVLGKQVVCSVPVVYASNGSIRGRVRFDVYQTRGADTMYLSQFNLSDFSLHYLSLNQNEMERSVAAMTKLKTVNILSTDISSGGRDALDFETNRRRIIDHSVGPRIIPITPSQAGAYLEDEGYRIVESVDTLTQRFFWATTSLPTSKSSNSVAPPSASMLSLTTDMDYAKTCYGVTEHDTGITLTTSCLYLTDNNISSLLTVTDYEQLNSLSLIDQAKRLNDGAYSSSLFYYVYDNTAEDFEVRPYSLDAPEIEKRNFITENPTTGLQVSIGQQFSVSKTSLGYRLTLTTSSNQTYQDLSDTEVFCQLALRGPGQAATAYLMGTQLPRANDQGERVFVFDLYSKYDINRTHAMVLDNFEQEASSNKSRTALSQLFTVFFGTTSAPASTYLLSDIDSKLGYFMLNPGAIGLTQEELTIRFGHHLDTLWVNFRTAAGEIPYKTHLVDVPLTYENDVYDKDPGTGSAISVVSGNIVYNVLHLAGDPILNGQGEPILKHAQGDVVLDSLTNKPVPQDNYSTILKRTVDIFVLDAIFTYANSVLDTTYLQLIKTELLKRLTKDLTQINKRTLEKTTVYFYPRVSRGVIDVRVGQDIRQAVEAEQALEFVLYVSQDTYQNTYLLSQMRAEAIKAGSTYLAENTTVSSSNAADAIKQAVGDQLLGIAIKGLLGGDDPVVVTLIDSSTRLSIAKILTVQSDNVLTVADDVKISFVVHNTTTL